MYSNGLSAIRKIFRSLRNKEKYFSITVCIISFQENRIILIEKRLFIGFSFRLRCFSLKENSPILGDKICRLSSNKSYYIEIHKPLGYQCNRLPSSSATPPPPLVIFPNLTILSNRRSLPIGYNHAYLFTKMKRSKFGGTDGYSGVEEGGGRIFKKNLGVREKVDFWNLRSL